MTDTAVRGGDRASSRPVAVVLLILATVATAMIAFGPRWLVSAGQAAFERMLAGHVSVEAFVSALGGIQDAGNVVLFVPLAALVAAAVPVRGLAIAFVLCAPLPAVVEFAQRWVPGRVPDVSDVILNTVGLVLAFAAVVAVRMVVAVGSGVRRRDGKACHRR